MLLFGGKHNIVNKILQAYGSDFTCSHECDLYKCKHTFNEQLFCVWVMCLNVVEATFEVILLNSYLMLLYRNVLFSKVML